MKKNLIILLSFISLGCSAQFFVRVDTSSAWLPQPPLALKYLTVTIANPGDTTQLLDSLYAVYTFEEAAGDLLDLEGGRDMTVSGTVTRQQAGINDYCYSFTTDGQAKYTPDDFEFNDDYSISFWEKNNNGGSYMGFVTYYGGSGRGWAVRQDDQAAGSGQVRAEQWWNGGQDSQYGYVQIVNDDNWYHIVYTFDKSELTQEVWINGIKRGSGSGHAIDYETDCDLEIGSHDDAYFYEGEIDEVYIYRGLVLSPEKISELYSGGDGSFYPFGGAGGDSLNMTALGHDSRADTFRVQAKLSGYPTNEDDGTNLFAYGIADTSDYNDTTFAHSLTPKDTTWYILHGSGLDPEDVWAYTYDTVFLDSSNVTPPVQDAGDWDTLFYEDFEQYGGAPLEYTTSLYPSDFNTPWRDSDHRWPSYFTGKFQDSIDVDDETSSKVLQIWNARVDPPQDGYCGNLSPHSGEYFEYVLDGDSWLDFNSKITDSDVDEMYYSYNIKFRQDWNCVLGGKLSGVYAGGPHTMNRPTYGEGFSGGLMFVSYNFYDNGISGPPMGIAFYMFYQNSAVSYYGETTFWDDFQPTGANMNYTNGRFYFDVSGEEWYNITLRVVLNTFTGETANADGLIEGFINGKLIAQKSGMTMITWPDRNNLLRAAVANFFGGGSCGHQASRDGEWFYMDDLICFIYKDGVDVPRGNELSSPGRVLNLPGDPKWDY